jgi:hypothetical protein
MYLFGYLPGKESPMFITDPLGLSALTALATATSSLVWAIRRKS